MTTTGADIRKGLLRHADDLAKVRATVDEIAV